MRFNSTYLSAIVAGLFAPAFTGCHPASTAIEPGALPTATVSTVTVQTRAHQAFEEVVGSVQSRQRAEIGPKISARVERVLAAPGTTVRTGDLLAQLDDREIQARLDQARATLEQAEADLGRFTGLLKQESVTQAEFDAVQARERIARATQVEAETLLAHTRVTAPFDGVITRKMVEVGDLALPGRPMFILEDPGALRLEVDVPEALIARVKPDAELQVRVAAVEGPLTGRVSEISPAADPQSRTFRVKLDLPSAEGLRLGQFGRAAVPVEGNAAVHAPAEAVALRGQLEMVYVVDDGHARLRLVKTGKRLGTEVELVSGVEPGEVLVVGGLNQLQDGQPVEVR